MKNFFTSTKKKYTPSSEEKTGLNEELCQLFSDNYSQSQLQSLFNEYLESNATLNPQNQFITTLTENLDKIHDGNLLYQAYKIIRSPVISAHQPYLDILLRATNLGSFHAKHELAMMALIQHSIISSNDWIIWGLEHLRTAIDNYYDLPNNLFNIKNLFRDLLRINTFLQSVIENYDFYIDTMPKQISAEYQELIDRLYILHQKNVHDYLISLPIPNISNENIRIHQFEDNENIYEDSPHFFSL